MQQQETSRRQQRKTSPAAEPIRFDRRLIGGLDDQGVADLAARWQNSRHIRELVSGALTKALEGAILQSESREVLNSPNALAALADLHGYRRGLREAIRLLTNQDQS